MTDDDDSKSALDHTLDVFVYLPLGFVLDFPRSVPRYIQRGREQLHPSRLLARQGSGSGPAKHLQRVQDQTRNTLRALGVVGAEAPSNGTASVRAPQAATGPATAEPPPRPDATAAATPMAAAPPMPVTDLAIPDYDSLSASQVVPRLDSLGADELETIRQYEAATRGRKTILSKIALLQSS